MIQPTINIQMQKQNKKGSISIKFISGMTQYNWNKYSIKIKSASHLNFTISQAFSTTKLMLMNVHTMKSWQ